MEIPDARSVGLPAGGSPAGAVPGAGVGRGEAASGGPRAVEGGALRAEARPDAWEQPVAARAAAHLAETPLPEAPEELLALLVKAAGEQGSPAGGPPEGSLNELLDVLQKYALDLDAPPAELAPRLAAWLSGGRARAAVREAGLSGTAFTAELAEALTRAETLLTRAAEVHDSAAGLFVRRVLDALRVALNHLAEGETSPPAAPKKAEATPAEVLAAAGRLRALAAETAQAAAADGEEGTSPPAARDSVLPGTPAPKRAAALLRGALEELGNVVAPLVAAETEGDTAPARTTAEGTAAKTALPTADLGPPAVARQAPATAEAGEARLAVEGHGATVSGGEIPAEEGVAPQPRPPAPTDGELVRVEGVPARLRAVMGRAAAEALATPADAATKAPAAKPGPSATETPSAEATRQPPAVTDGELARVEGALARLRIGIGRAAAEASATTRSKATPAVETTGTTAPTSPTATAETVVREVAAASQNALDEWTSATGELFRGLRAATESLAAAEGEAERARLTSAEEGIAAAQGRVASAGAAYARLVGRLFLLLRERNEALPKPPLPETRPAGRPQRTGPGAAAAHGDRSLPERTAAGGETKAELAAFAATLQQALHTAWVNQGSASGEQEGALGKVIRQALRNLFDAAPPPLPAAPNSPSTPHAPNAANAPNAPNAPSASPGFPTMPAAAAAAAAKAALLNAVPLPHGASQAAGASGTPGVGTGTAAAASGTGGVPVQTTMATFILPLRVDGEPWPARLEIRREDSKGGGGKGGNGGGGGGAAGETETARAGRAWTASLDVASPTLGKVSFRLALLPREFVGTVRFARAYAAAAAREEAAALEERLRSAGLPAPRVLVTAEAGVEAAGDIRIGSTAGEGPTADGEDSAAAAAALAEYTRKD